jgi:succinate-acetate transporter protein
MEQTTDRSALPLSRANPAALGFAALGITTALFGTYNAANAHSLPLIGLTLVVAGLMQILMSLIAYGNRDTYGLTIFGSYGALAVILGGLVLGRATGTFAGPFLAGDGISWFYFVFAVLGFYIWVASVRVSGAVALTTLLAGAMLVALWLGSITNGTPGNGWTAIAGWLGWATAIAAGYTSFAELINANFGRMVLPEFPMRRARPAA